MGRQLVWRGCLIGGGIAIAVGGSMHPGGSMAEMLADPDWLLSHLFVLAGFVALTAALALLRGHPTVPPRTRRWMTPAIWASLLQSIDYVFHAAAMVDHGHLVAGEPTPILTIHLVMTAVVYPIFGVLIVAVLVAAARDGMLGSWWIAWLGILGAIGHGAAGPLVVIWGIPWARNLFPMIVLLALWMILAALWPLPKPATTTADDRELLLSRQG